MTDLAIIVLSYNTKDLLRKCLKSVLSKKWNHNIEVCVVDNASGDQSVEMVKKEFPHVKLIESNKNLGFPGGNNLALREIKSRNYILLNSDTEVTDGSLDIILEFMKNNKFDLATCKLVNPDGSLQPNAGDLPFGGALFNWLMGVDDLPNLKNNIPSFHKTSADFYRGEKEVGWISGTAFVLTQDVLKNVGLLDENIFMYCEDVDYCNRAKKAGYKIGWTDKAIIMHIGGASSAKPQLRQWTGEFRGLIYLYKKYFGALASILLKIIIYFAILLRIIAFTIKGKLNYVKTYIQVLGAL